jgi:hypothetical protein
VERTFFRDVRLRHLLKDTGKTIDAFNIHHRPTMGHYAIDRLCVNILCVLAITAKTFKLPEVKVNQFRSPTDRSRHKRAKDCGRAYDVSPVPPAHAMIDP